MYVLLKKGVWYDADGKKISNKEKKYIQKEIYTKLNKELNNTRFESILKWFIFKIIK
ncbi:hypothetical protein [Streptococcus pluranimalium]|uniref:hypothetical protein n=1 Tax=Streptococcus pluranimalium TaxID=82348 RepID=UPI00313A1B1B